MRTIRKYAARIVVATAILCSMANKANAIEATYTLDEQIKILAGFGITLSKDVSVDDLLYLYDKEEFESEPFELLLFTFGNEVESEPLGRFFSNDAWFFDYESIYGDGSYVYIVENLARLSNMESSISDIKDSIDYKSEKAWVSYKLNGKLKRYNAKFDFDWADRDVLISVMNDLASPGYSFYEKQGGQDSTWYYLADEMADELNKITNNALVKH